MRVRIFKMDNVELRWGVMNCKQVEEFTETGRALLKRINGPESNRPTVKEWEERTYRVVRDALNRAVGDESWTRDRMDVELDPKLIGLLFREILDEIGFKEASAAGEQKAATQSSASAAA